MCPCGKAKEGRLIFVGECGMYEEGWAVLEEMRKIDECDM